VIERQPLRRALFGDGSSGGSSGGSWGGSTGGFAGVSSTGGLSTTGGFGSTGGLSLASSGLESLSGLDSFGPIAASPVLASPIDSIGFGCTGGLATSSPSLVSAPLLAASDFGVLPQSSEEFAYQIPLANEGTAYQLDAIPVAVSQYETSAPILDFGTFNSQVGILGSTTDASLIDGNFITGAVLEGSPVGGVPIDSGFGGGDFPGPADFPGAREPAQPFSSPSDLGPDDGIGAIEENDSASVKKKAKSGFAILTLDVPEDSIVYVNDRRTRTRGTRRSYASRNLQPGEQYRYRLKVVSQVDGKEVIKRKTVLMNANDRELLSFNFKPVVTRIALVVPEDATVTIDGSETDSEGTNRSFSTRKLTSGKWEGYSVEVSVVRDGRTMTQRRDFDLIAGEFRFLLFDFDGSSDSDVATKK